VIRSRNPRLDVGELERRIDDELARDPEAALADERLVRLAAAVHARAIEAQLTFAEQRSTPRTTWPVDLRLPLVSSSEWMKKAVLRLMSLAFRDQYEANNALIRSQRELLALVQTLLERVEGLEARLETERAATRAQRIAARSVEGNAANVIPSDVEGQSPS
jgi:hypothetical protein